MPTLPITATSSRRIPRGVDLLEELRLGAEIAAIVGAADAALAVERGGDLRVLGSVAGTFPERTFAGGICPSSDDPARWLSPAALADLYLPPHAHVLAAPVARCEWSGVLLLRFEQASEAAERDVSALLSHGAQEPVAA